jgi:hypothetical protein
VDWVVAGRSAGQPGLAAKDGSLVPVGSVKFPFIQA